MQKTTIGLAFLILTLGNSLSAGGPLEDLSGADIEKSTQRLRKVYKSEKPNDSDIRLFEAANTNHAVGVFSASENQVTISFRGTAGTQDLMSANSKGALPLGYISPSLEGSGHEGYTTAFKGIDQEILKEIKAYSNKVHITPKDMKFRLEGYSRGAHFAKLALLSLAVREDTKSSTKLGLFYADGNTFDDKATAFGNKVIGQDNMLSFRAEGDIIANYPSISNSHLGTPITFSPEGVGTYYERVTDKVYTDMDPNLTMYAYMFSGNNETSSAKSILDFLKPKYWEAHADITYREGAPGAFLNWKLNKTNK